MRTTPTITTYNPSAAAAGFRFPTGSAGAAANGTATVSPDTSTGDSGVTIVGLGTTASLSLGTLADMTTTHQYIGYIHATADASL